MNLFKGFKKVIFCLALIALLSEAIAPQTLFAASPITGANETGPIPPVNHTLPSDPSLLALTPKFPAYFWPVNSASSVSYDANGIPMFKYDGVLQYNTVTIEQMALYNYNNWKSTGSYTSQVFFFKLADWLVANQTSDGLWLYTFNFLNEPVPWWSAMAQGQGISVLVRAYAATNKPAYKTAATLALGTFTRTIANRGVTASDNGTWYEEYLPPSHTHVLNGMIFAMMGLRDYNQEFNDALSLGLWNTGVTTLVNNLSKFDTGSWSYYDLGDHLVASIHYHELHISLLTTMYSITNIHTFNDYRARFQKYLDAR